jgi:cell wall-associated NlpC family hydrolase
MRARTPGQSQATPSLVATSDTRWYVAGSATADAAEFFSGAIMEAIRDSIVRVARAQLGRRYRYGGATPDRGFDCSGLVRYVLGMVQVALPRLAAQQARAGEPIARDHLQPGDLLAFGDADTVSHIGIYIGDGKYVHASSVAGRVIVSPLDRPKSRAVQPLRGARRLLARADRVEHREGS